MSGSDKTKDGCVEQIREKSADEEEDEKRQEWGLHYLLARSGYVASDNVSAGDESFRRTNILPIPYLRDKSDKSVSNGACLK